MAEDPSGEPGGEEGLEERLGRLGGTLGAREAEHRRELEAARACLEKLRSRVAAALEAFHRAAADAGAPYLRVALSEIRVDDKHLRALEFDLSRGRHKAIITAKSRGEITLVGPFRTGKVEGPCLSFPFESERELDAALSSFLERFAEEAATP